MKVVIFFTAAARLHLPLDGRSRKISGGDQRSKVLSAVNTILTDESFKNLSMILQFRKIPIAQKAGSPCKDCPLRQEISVPWPHENSAPQRRLGQSPSQELPFSPWRHVCIMSTHTTVQSAGRAGGGR